MELRRACTRLEVARRRVREGEQQVRGQKNVVTDLQMHGQRTSHAFAMLKAQQTLLQIARDNLALEEARLRRGSGRHSDATP